MRLADRRLSRGEFHLELLEGGKVELVMGLHAVGIHHLIARRLGLLATLRMKDDLKRAVIHKSAHFIMRIKHTHALLARNATQRLLLGVFLFFNAALLLGDQLQKPLLLVLESIARLLGQSLGADLEIANVAAAFFGASRIRFQLLKRRLEFL